MNHQSNVNMDERRCHECNQYYFVEMRAGIHRCPYCAVTTLDERWKQLEHKDRVIRGLRSALKQRKAKR